MDFIYSENLEMRLFLTRKTDTGGRVGSSHRAARMQDRKDRTEQRRGRLYRTGNKLYYLPPKDQQNYRLCWRSTSNLGGTKNYD